MDIQKRPVTPKENEEIWWRPALLLFFRVSSWIGVPIIIAIFLGSWLDEKYGTGPKLYFISVALAFIISTIGLIKEVAQASRKMENESKKNSASNQTKNS